MLRLFNLIIIAVIFICVVQGEICKPIDCKGKMKCRHGFQKENNCEICKCNDPCNPPGNAFPCGFNRRCFVGKNFDGTSVARCGAIRKKRSNDACGQEKLPGLCKAFFPRFYYDLNTKKCEQFVYGGCGGNDNNFETKDECEKTCVK